MVLRGIFIPKRAFNGVARHLHPEGIKAIIRGSPALRRTLGGETHPYVVDPGWVAADAVRCDPTGVDEGRRTLRHVPGVREDATPG